MYSNLLKETNCVKKFISEMFLLKRQIYLQSDHLMTSTFLKIKTIFISLWLRTEIHCETFEDQLF